MATEGAEATQRSRSTIEDVQSRLQFLRELGVHHHPPRGVCSERQRRYAQQLRRRRPARWRSLSEPGRTLELVCYLYVTLLQTVDLLLSLLDLRITDIRRTALTRAREREAQTPNTLWRTFQTAKRMAEDPALNDADFRAAFLTLVPADAMPPPSRAATLRTELIADRRFKIVLATLLVIGFKGPADSPLLKALSQLSTLRVRRLSTLPPDMAVDVPPSWSALVQSEDRKQALRAFEAATLLSLQKALRNGSIWVNTSLSYRSRDEMFISAEQWQKQRQHYYQRLRLPRIVDTYLKPQLAALETGLAAVADAVERDEISIDQDGVHLARLADESEDRSVMRARKRLYRQIGEVQLPALIVDIDRETRFSWVLLGRPPHNAHELRVLYGALLAHGTAINAGGVALMMPGVSEASIADAMHFL